MLERFTERARRVIADLDRARRLLGVSRRMFGRASDDSVHLIATSKWRVRI